MLQNYIKLDSNVKNKQKHSFQSQRTNSSPEIEMRTETSVGIWKRTGEQRLITHQLKIGEDKQQLW